MLTGKRAPDHFRARTEEICRLVPEFVLVKIVCLTIVRKGTRDSQRGIKTQYFGCVRRCPDHAMQIAQSERTSSPVFQTPNSRELTPLGKPVHEAN